MQIKNHALFIDEQTKLDFFDTMDALMWRGKRHGWTTLQFLLWQHVIDANINIRRYRR